jgi:phage gp29-like protein
MFGDWYWNPEATVTNWRSLPAANRLAPEDFIIRQVARHIDRPGLIKQIRKNLGEKDWSGFLEIYGIPTPIIIMPTGAKDSDKNLYEGACSAIAQGRPVALPAGSDARYPGEVRGNAPFKEYLDWCDGQLVLIGTGGLLSMLSMATGIGSGASETHDAAFQSIAKAEAFRISELFQRQLDKPFLAEEFPGKPILAYFEIAAQESTDPGTILDHAVKAKNAGFVMDAAEISEQTGYKLTPAPQPAAPAPFGALPDPAAAIPGLRATLNAEIDAATLRVAAKDMLAEAMDADLAPVRARIAAALALEDDDAMVAALRAVQADLPAILAEILAAPQAETALAEIAAQSLAEGAKAAAKERS